MTRASRRGSITGAAAGRWEELILLPLFFVSIYDPPGAGPPSWLHLLWFAALLFSATASYLKYQRGVEPDRFSLAALMAAFLLLFNGVIVMDGGLESPLRAGYFLLLLLFSRHFARPWQQGAAFAAVVLLEAGQLAAARAFTAVVPGRGVTALQVLLTEAFLLGLFLLALHVFYLRRQLRLQESVSEHVRLREEAESLRALEGHRSGATLEAHSRQERDLRRLSTVDKQNRDLERLLTLARRALGARQVLYYRSDGDRLRLASSSANEKVVPVSSMPVGAGIVGGAANLQKSVLITSFERSRRPLRYLAEGSTVGSLMVVPLKEQEVLRGVLVADHGEQEKFSRAELEIFEGFSLEVNLVIEHTKESAIWDRRHTTLEILCAFSDTLSHTLEPEKMIEKLVEGTEDIFSFDQCAVFIVDPDRRRIVLRSQRGFGFKAGTEISFPLGRGLVGYIIDHDQPLIFSDRKKMEIVPGYTGEERMRSFMGHPLRFRDDLAGAIIFAAAGVGFFTNSSFETLKLLAYQASAQLSNAFLHKQVEKLARTDGLTGLYNHRSFQERLDYELRRADRQEHPLSLLLLDIDLFKRLNDNYGHPFGDEVLKGVSKALSRMARSIDFVARYGGEEFAIILTDSNRKGAGLMAERVLKAVSRASFHHEEKGRDLSVTVSVGSSTFPDDGKAKEDIIGRADQALYLAKESGRNCHRSYRDVASA